jgi:hypothetical protein
MLHIEGTEVGHKGRGLQRLLCIRDVHDDHGASFSDGITVGAFGVRRSARSRAAPKEVRERGDKPARRNTAIVVYLCVNIGIGLRLHVNVVARQAGPDHSGDGTQRCLAIFERAKNRVHEGRVPRVQPRFLPGTSQPCEPSERCARLYGPAYQNSINKWDGRWLAPIANERARAAAAESGAGDA